MSDYDQVIKDTELALTASVKAGNPVIREKVRDMIYRIASELGEDFKPNGQVDALMNQTTNMVFENIRARIALDTAKRQAEIDSLMSSNNRTSNVRT